MRFINKIVPFLIVFMVWGGIAWAQEKKDVLIKRNGEKLDVQVRQLTQSEIYYGEPGMPQNVFKTISIADVAAILYADGRVQTFETAVNLPPAVQPAATEYLNAPPPVAPSQNLAPLASGQALGLQSSAPAATDPILSPMQMYEMGYSDSRLYYRKFKPAATGTLVAAILVGPLFGLIPAIACASTPPSTMNLGYSPSPYANDMSYRAGYKEGAAKKKRTKVWANFGIGTGVLFGLILLSSVR